MTQASGAIGDDVATRARAGGTVIPAASVRALRKDVLAWTQEKAGERFRVTMRQWQRYEDAGPKGQQIPWSTWELLCQIAGVDPETWRPPPAPPSTEPQ